MARERPSSLERLRGIFFRTPSDKISHRIHIVRISCSQLPARSGIFCLLVEVVYWPCGLINLFFSGDNCHVKLPAKFLAQFWMIVSPNKSWRKIVFLSCPRHSDRGLVVVIIYYFQIWNKKEQKIIMSRVISSHMVGLYTFENLRCWTKKMFLKFIRYNDLHKQSGSGKKRSS